MRRRARAPPHRSGPAAAAISFALAQVGKPYVFFTAGPGAFDCSGLTMAAYSRVGVSLIHQAASQARRGRAVDFWSQPIKAGDLVFLDGDWDGTIDHVGMALGPTTWVQASQSHDRVMTGPLPSAQRDHRRAPPGRLTARPDPHRQISGARNRAICTKMLVEIGQGWGASSAMACSRILNFCTLPVTVIGNSSTNFT